MNCLLSWSLLLSVLATIVCAQLSDVSTYSDHFDRDGFLVLRKFFYKSKLREWRRFYTNYFQEIFRVLHEKGHTSFPLESRKRPDGSPEYAMAIGKHNGFAEIVMRSPGRYELSMLRGKTPTNEIPTVQPLLDELAMIIPSLLHVDSMEDVSVDYSMIVSTAQAATQGWHSDGDHYRLDEHMPCHVLNVFIPLSDVAEANGPTELIPSSHFQTRSAGTVKLRSDQLRSPVTPLLNLGDILIFDYRVIHRGGPNLSESNRPLLVLTLSQKWFHDTKNWPTRSLFGDSDPLKVASPLNNHPALVDVEIK
jgi:Phytanoyl-CoA dioxygenase (PhyH)